jgi:predicted secreted protein
MSITLGLALYFVIWWTVLFAVLPIGLRTQHEEGEVVPGTPASAPARPRLLRIFLLNTLVAAVVFAIVWAVIVYRLISIDIVDVPGVR